MHTLTVKKCNAFEKIIGLVGKTKPYPIYFQTRFGIHTFGLPFSIDVIILDKQKKIIKYKMNLKPNNIFLWSPLYQDVIELPEGTIIKNHFRLGEEIDLVIK